jgi:hypothetical protein
MRYTSLLGALAVVYLAAPVRAEVHVETPWVVVHVGRPLPPAPPLGAIQVDPPPVPMPPPPEVITVAPSPVPGPVYTTALRPPTLAEFAASFHPQPGHYEVVLLNPETCCPVKICFTLPCGCPTIRLHDKSLVFHYGLLDNVAIRFHHDGSVSVKD